MYNNKLYQQLNELTKLVLPIYTKEVDLNSQFNKDNIYILISLHKLDPKIKKISEFNSCIQIMLSDPKMIELKGKLVGSLSEQSLITDEESSILNFLRQIFLKNNIYSFTFFENQYNEFEELFYSTKLRYIDSTGLYNFDFENEEINLSDEINIKKKALPNKYTNNASHYVMGYTTFSRSSLIIERKYQIPKRVKSSTNDKKDIDLIDKNELTEELNASSVIFDLVITSLRILKHSGIYRDHKIESKMTTFHPSKGISIRSQFKDNIVVGEKLKLKESDLQNLKEIFTCISNNRKGIFAVATRRLSSGMERQNHEDKIIDYMIGFESLYLPDGNNELSFRLSLRVAFLLGKTSEEKKSIFFLLRKMYNIRSKIVHGSPYNIEEKDVKKVEELLRNSLKLWIKDKENFSINKFTNSGNLTKEGKLDTLFFE